MYSCDGKAEFSAAITPVFVTWCFRSLMLKKDYLLSMLKKSWAA